MNIRKNPVIIPEKEEMPNIVISSEDTMPKYRVNVDTEGGDINEYLA